MSVAGDGKCLLNAELIGKELIHCDFYEWLYSEAYKLKYACYEQVIHRKTICEEQEVQLLTKIFTAPSISNLSQYFSYHTGSGLGRSICTSEVSFCFRSLCSIEAWSTSQWHPSQVLELGCGHISDLFEVNIVIFYLERIFLFKELKPPRVK